MANTSRSSSLHLAVFASFAKKVLAVWLCAVLVFNCFLEPRRHAYAVVSEIVAGLALDGFVTEVLIPSLVIAGVGFSVSNMSSSDYELLASDFIGNDAVPANREYAEQLYSSYQANGSVIVNGSDVPTSVFDSIVNGIQSTLSSFSVPFPLSYVYDNAGGSAAVDALNNPTSLPSNGSLSPIYYCWVRRVNRSSGVVDYYFELVQFAIESGNFINIAPASNEYGSGFSVTGKGNYARRSGFIRVASSGTYSVGSSFLVRSPDWANTSFRTFDGSSMYAVAQGGTTDYDFSSCVISTDGFAVNAPSVPQTPAAVESISNGLASGTLSAGQAVTDIQTQLANQQIALNSVIESYTDIVGAIEGGTDDITGGIDTANGFLEQILSALGVSGAIASGVASVVSGISALPTTLAGLLFNTSLRSIAPEAITSLDDMLSAYFADLPTWLHETGTTLQGIPSNIALAMDGHFADVIYAINQTLAQVTGIPAEIPAAFGTVITGIPAQVWGLFDGPIGDIITGVSSVTDGILGLPAALGDIALNVDLSAVLQGMAAIPLSIAGVLNLDWVTDTTEELKSQLDLDSQPSIALPSATWDQVTSVAADFGELTPLPYMERCINIVFDTFAGNGNSAAPRYEIVFPNPWGEDWVFVVDFALFDGRFVTVSHGLFYVSFAIWYWGFLKRIKAHWDEILQSVYTHPAAA